MKCKKCGVELLPAQKFCYNCGTLNENKQCPFCGNVTENGSCINCGRNWENYDNRFRQYRIKRGNSVNRELLFCEQCQAKRRTKSLWMRVITAVLFVALLLGIVLHFGGSRILGDKTVEWNGSIASDTDKEIDYEPVYAEENIEPLTKVVMYDNGQLDREYLFDYNDNNQLICQTLKLYDDLGKLYHETETKYTYTSDGKLSKIGEGEFRTEFTYNSKKQLVSLFSNLTTPGEVRYEYDNAGKLIRSTAPNSSCQDTRSTTEYIYKDGLLVEKNMTSPSYDTDGSLVEYIYRTTYTYDDLGRVRTEKRVGNHKIKTLETQHLYGFNSVSVEQSTWEGESVFYTISLEDPSGYILWSQTFDEMGVIEDGYLRDIYDNKLDYAYKFYYGDYGRTVDVALNPLGKLLVGDSLEFGTYEQDGFSGNDAEDIEWIILDKTADKILVVSKYALDCQRYHRQNESVTWETCSVRTWLNSTFYNAAFSADEKQRILTTKDTETSVQDKIFLLSIDELEEYFSDKSERICRATSYAIDQNAYVNPSTGGSWWLLRTEGESSHHVMSVNSDGKIDYEGGKVASDRGTVRPVMWLDISN